MNIKTKYTARIIFFSFISVLFALLADSISVDKIALAIIVIALILLGAKEKTFLNPYYFFVITPFSLLIYFNVIDFYLLDLTHETYLLAIINIFAFMFGIAVFKNNGHLGNEKGGNLIESNYWMRTFIFFSLSAVGYLLPALYSIFWLFSIPGIVYAIKSRNFKLIILALSYILLVSTISLSKTSLLLYSLTFLIGFSKYYIFSRKQSLWLKLFTIFGIVLLIYGFSFANKERGRYDAEEGLEYYGRMGHSWEYDATLFLPYMYLVSPWTNVQYVLETQDSRTYGLWVIKPFINYAQLDDYFKKEYKIQSYSNFNTFTFVSVAFKDFGYWFSVLSTLIIAFFVKKVYNRFLISNSPIDTATYVIFALATIQMYFSNHFYMVSYPFTMLIVMGITKFFIYKVK